MYRPVRNDERRTIQEAFDSLSSSGVTPRGTQKTDGRQKGRGGGRGGGGGERISANKSVVV